jgi:hypothetical protein
MIGRAFLLLTALCAPALAQTEPGFLSGAKDAANQLQLYLDSASKTGNRPDFSAPSVSDLFARVFDARQIETLGAPQAGELAWLLQWISTVNGVAKSIFYFGVTPSAKPTADEIAAIERNAADYEDQHAIAISYEIRIAAREAQDLVLFMNTLPPDQRTPVRQAGLDGARNGGAEMIYGALVQIAQNAKPANSRQLSGAMNDTRSVWADFLNLQAKTQLIDLIQRVEKATKDESVQKDLAALNAALASGK